MDGQVTAMFWERCKESNDCKTVKCLLCPQYCRIREGSSGKCTVRKNVSGKLVATAYGKVSAIADDPIEKKPLYEFHSGKRILSVGSVGCNFHCPFCQNHNISLDYDNAETRYASPEKILSLAQDLVKNCNIGVAYTYNEPLINIEFILDCARLIKKNGLMNVLVTNGYVNIEPFLLLLPYIDAMNVDIKGSAQGTYKTVGGTDKYVKNVIEEAYGSCHIEITTLVIQGENENDVAEIAKWISGIDKDIPYHLSRFFPRYKYKDRPATPFDTMYKAKAAAEQYLNKVYLGNM